MSDSEEKQTGGDSEETTEETAATGGAEETAASDDAEAVEATQTAEDVEGEEEEDKPIPYELEVEEMKEGSILHLRFKVDYEHFEEKTKDTFEELRRETIIEGFRKGKAPLNLIRARFGRDVEKDAIQSIRGNVLGQYFEEKSPEVLTEPEFEEDTAPVKEGEPLIVDVSMEARPKLDAIEFGDLAVEVETYEVTDEDVQGQLERLRRSQVSHKVKDGPFEGGEEGVTVDVVVTDDRDREVSSLARQDERVPRPADQLPEPVFEALEGKKAGDTVEAATPHKRENRAGATLSEKDHWKVTIKEVLEPEYPEIDDDFAKDIGEFECLNDLKADIRKRLEEAEENRRRGAAVRAVCDRLIERNPIEAPPSMIASSAQRIAQEEIYRDLMAGGGRPADLLSDESRAARSERHGETAARMVKTFILMDELGRLEDVEVTEEDVDEEIEKMAEEEGRRPLALRAQLEAQQRLDDVRARVRERKIQDLLLEKATVEYKPGKRPGEDASE